MDLTRPLTVTIRDVDFEVLGCQTAPSGVWLFEVPVDVGGYAREWLVWDGEVELQVALRPPVLLDAGSKVTVDVVHVSFAWGPTTLEIEAAVAELVAMASTLRS